MEYAVLEMLLQSLEGGKRVEAWMRQKTTEAGITKQAPKLEKYLKAGDFHDSFLEKRCT